MTCLGLRGGRKNAVSCLKLARSVWLRPTRTIPPTFIFWSVANMPLAAWLSPLEPASERPQLAYIVCANNKSGRICHGAPVGRASLPNQIKPCRHCSLLHKWTVHDAQALRLLIPNCGLRFSNFVLNSLTKNGAPRPFIGIKRIHN